MISKVSLHQASVHKELTEADVSLPALCDLALSSLYLSVNCRQKMQIGFTPWWHFQHMIAPPVQNIISEERLQNQAIIVCNGDYVLETFFILEDLDKIWCDISLFWTS